MFPAVFAVVLAISLVVWGAVGTIRTILEDGAK